MYVSDSINGIRNTFKNEENQKNKNFIDLIYILLFITYTHTIHQAVSHTYSF